MAGSKLRVCVVGCGDMGMRHARNWSLLPEAEVVAVADTKEERAQQLAELLGLSTWHTDYRAAISTEGVDVISVCIPTCWHAEVTVFAAEHGRHVLCEKPIALTLADADRMIEAARKHRVRLGIGFMRRYSPVLDAMRDWLGSGGLGRPVMYHTIDIRGLRPKREMHDANANAGPVVDQGVHEYDTWSYVFGAQPVSVSAQGLKLAEGRAELAHIRELAYDTANVIVHYSSGDVGSLVISWGLPPDTMAPGGPQRIFGPKGLALAAFTDAVQEVRVLRPDGSWDVVSASSEDMYQREIAGFARCVLEGRPLPATGEDGRAALQVALAALESIRTGQTVALD